MNEANSTQSSKIILKDGLEVRFADTNKLLFVRYKIERHATGSKFLSRDDFFEVLAWHGGMAVGVGSKSGFKKINVQALKIKKLDPPKIINDNKDWNYKADQHKGNTLAKRARKIELLFALKRGRPENPNSLPLG